MEEYKWTDLHFPLSAINASMFTLGAVEGNTAMMAYNGSFFMMNIGLATSGRKDDIRQGAGEVKNKALREIYDSALKENLMEASEEDGVECGRRTSERRVC